MHNMTNLANFYNGATPEGIDLLINIGSYTLDKNFSKFVEARSKYILLNQLLFVKKDNFEDIQDSQIVIDNIKQKIKTAKKQFPGLRDENLKKEFNTRVINCRLSLENIRFLIETFKDSNRLDEYMNREKTYSKNSKLNISRKHMNYLLSTKQELMKRLGVKEEDFEINFDNKSFVRMIK